MTTPMSKAARVWRDYVFTFYPFGTPIDEDRRVALLKVNEALRAVGEDYEARIEANKDHQREIEDLRSEVYNLEQDVEYYRDQYYAATAA